MKLSRLLFPLACATTLALTACAPQNTAPGQPTASSQPSTPASSQPASPAKPGEQPVTPASPTTPVMPTPPTASGSGKITVIGADLFAKYAVDYQVGKQWVYSLQMPGGLTPQIPNVNDLLSKLPAGFRTAQTVPDLSAINNLIGNLTGTGGSTSSNTSTSRTSELGEISWTVVAVEGDMVTIETRVNMTLAKTTPAPTRSTFSKKSPAALYSEINQESDTTGTYTYTLIGGPENVSVAGGSFSTDKLAGKLKATSKGSTIEQDATLWMAAGVGLVKQEVNSVVAGIKTTTILELKSYK
jgi:hypothetical protein